jgi:hypothetical protein
MDEKKIEIKIVIIKKLTSFAACARLTASTFSSYIYSSRPAHLAPLVIYIYRIEYMIE